MKILHLLYESKGDPFGIGGVGIRAYEIYKHIKERHDVTLLCKKYPGANDGQINGLRHIFVGTESKNLTKTLLSYAYHSTLFVRRHDREFDIIIEEFSPAIPTFLHAFTKKPVILQIQGYTGKFYFKKYNPAYASILYMMEQLRPMFYDNFIFVSDSTWKRYHIGNPKKNIEIILNGISEKSLGYEPEEFDYILYLGRIDIHGKGLDVLLEAYRDFYSMFPDIKLIIAGDGRDREKFSALLRRLPEGIRQNIELKGWVNGERKAHLFKNALMVIMPSRYESQAIVLLEAMAYAKPIIVSDISEFCYVLQNKAGISFKTGDALSLSQSMKEIMLSNERKEMGQRGRNWVKDFTWDKIALKYEDFLCRVLEEQD